MAITAKKSEAGETIWAKSIVSGRTFMPLVELEWGKKTAQLDIEEARELALHILEAAEAAVSDAFVFHWLTKDTIGTTEDAKANFDAVIEEFTKFRESRTRQVS